MLKCLRGVHTHRDDTDDGTGPQQGVHPLQGGGNRGKKCICVILLNNKYYFIS